MTMALYKDQTKLQHNGDAAFDVFHSPSTPTPYSGIYRCRVCGHEIVSTYTHPLPPQNHHQHPAGQPIQWQLIVFAQHQP
jgi:hypothetical protein